MVGAGMAKPNPDFIAKLDACTVHARDLLTSAQAVLAAGKPNIAYHLAVLALEETGKRHLLGMLEVAEEFKLDPNYARKRLDDHVQKLFWAFFGGPLFKDRLTPKEMEEAQSLSRFFHGKRLAGLYVDADENGLNIPSAAISEKEAKNVVDLADALVSMAESSKPKEVLTDEDVARTQWFMASADNEEVKRLMFSKDALAKIKDFEEITDWVDWLKDMVDEGEKKNRELAAKEIARLNELPEKGTKPKWKVRFRIKSLSHSIRPNAFTEWNKNFPLLQLTPVGNKKPEIIAEITLLDNVPIQGLYHHAWGIARSFVVALNIASLGFFWWEFAEDRTKWYERIDDVDKPGVSAELQGDEGRIDWGGKRQLGQEDMARVIRAFASMPLPPEMEQRRKPTAVDGYISGLIHLAASSVHMPMYAEAVGNFVGSMQAMMEETGEWKRGEPFEPAFLGFVKTRNPDIDETDDLLGIIRAFDQVAATGKKANGPRPKGEHVSMMKLFCDWYFMEKVQPLTLDRIKKEREAA